ncbi:MAG: amine oxidase [Cytophagales bacterium]|nr:MAG: amine oxidase [Cytophagales bacterium]TAF59775.1 MAG: amine oxidase [Cytophagales bacterium]
MKRSDFLKSILLGIPATTIFPSVLASCDGGNEPQGTPKKGKRAIIIGAGIAGLASATKLVADEMIVTVLEARNRIGGRIFTDRSLGLPVDLGASWIHGPEKNPITDIANAAGAKTFETQDEPVNIYDAMGKLISPSKVDEYYDDYEDLIKAAKKKGNIPFSKAIQEINPAYLEDDLMVYQLSAFAEFDSGGPIEKLSAEYWDEDEVYDGDDVLFPNGYDAVTNHLAKGLDIKMEHIVKKINYSGTTIVVETNKGNFEADYVVCTLPLGVLKANKVTFEPALPASKVSAMSRVEMGFVNKVFLVFPQTFWAKENQYFGYTDPEKGRFCYFLDANKFVPGANALMTFGFGNYGLAMESKTDAQLVEEILTNLRKIFGSDVVPPLKFIVSRWNKDPYALGSYSYATAGSTPADFAETGKDVNKKLFFAGEHCTFEYKGTVHGAYLTGEKAAREIRQA